MVGVELMAVERGNDYKCVFVPLSFCVGINLDPPSDEEKKDLREYALNSDKYFACAWDDLCIIPTPTTGEGQNECKTWHKNYVNDAITVLFKDNSMVTLQDYLRKHNPELLK